MFYQSIPPVFKHLSEFLELQDIINLSVCCKALRSRYNQCKHIICPGKFLGVPDKITDPDLYRSMLVRFKHEPNLKLQWSHPNNVQEYLSLVPEDDLIQWACRNNKLEILLQYNVSKWFSLICQHCDLHTISTIYNKYKYLNLNVYLDIIYERKDPEIIEFFMLRIKNPDMIKIAYGLYNCGEIKQAEKIERANGILVKHRYYMCSYKNIELFKKMVENTGNVIKTLTYRTIFRIDFIEAAKYLMSQNVDPVDTRQVCSIEMADLIITNERAEDAITYNCIHGNYKVANYLVKKYDAVCQYCNNQNHKKIY